MKFAPTPAEALLERYGRDNLALLRTASSAREDSFNERYIPQLARFCEYVQELPLEPDGFNQPTGALIFGISSAFLALRMSDQSIFVNGQSHERRQLDPQYRFAAFNACLASTILLLQHHLIVTVGGRPWSYLDREPNLFQAASAAGSYEVGWTRNTRKPGSHFGIVVLRNFFDPGAWADFNQAVVMDMCSAINPAGTQTPGETPLAKVVRQGMDKARELESKGRAGQYQPPPVSPTTKLELGGIENLSLQPVSPAEASPEVEKPAVRKPALSDDLKAWASYIRSNSSLQSKLKLEPDGSIKFEAAYLGGAGVKGQEVYQWLKNGGYVISQHTEPTKHLVLSPSIAAELKVES